MKKEITYRLFLGALSRKRTLALSLLLLTLTLSCTEDESPINDNSTTTDDVITSDDTSGDDEGLMIAFAKILGGSENDSFKAVVTTPDGGYAALGDTQSIDGDITDNDTQINQLWLVKTDSQGTIQFSKTFGGSEDSRGTDIITTRDGGFAILGYSESNDGDLTENAGFYDHWVAKLDAQGTIVWQKSFGFSGSDQANALIQTSDGGFFTSGFLDVSASNGDGNNGLQDDQNDNNGTRATQHGVGEFWGHKLDANGNLEWRRYFGGSNNDRSYDVVQADDGGYLMIGSSESDDFDVSDSKGTYDFWAVRLDTSGTLLWEKSLGGSAIDIGYAVTKATDGGYIITGDTRSSDGDVSNFRGSADVWILKLSDQGEIIWQKTLGGSNFDTSRAITALPSGYAIVGASRSADDQVTTNNGQNDLWIATVDVNGNLTNQIVIGGNNQDFGYGITANAQGDIIIVGDTASSSGPLTTNNGNIDALLIKIIQ